MPLPSFAKSADRGSSTGVSLLEILIALAVALAIGAAALEALRVLRGQRAGREAARTFLHDLQEVAVRARLSGQSRGVAINADDDPTWVEYVDGNSNGVRMAEISAGIDRPAGPPRRVFREGAARLAIVTLVPTTDHSATLAAGSPPVRFGVSPLIVFTPRRTASSGSIYIAGPDARQYAVRVLGTTQRWRLLCLDDRTFSWEGC